MVYIGNNKQYDLLKWLDYNCLLLFEDYDNEFFLFSSYLHSKLTSNLDIIYYMEPYYGFTPEYLSISSIKFMYRRFKSLSFFALFTHIDFHDLLHPLIRLLSNYFSIHLSKPTSSIIKYTPYSTLPFLIEYNILLLLNKGVTPDVYELEELFTPVELS